MKSIRLLCLSAACAAALGGDVFAGPAAIQAKRHVSAPAAAPTKLAAIQASRPVSAPAAVPMGPAAIHVQRPVSVPVAVPMDNVTLVSFKQPVSTVYIGNPSIAELTIVDSRHVFVMGKRFGATNLIALGYDKTLLENDPITVSSRHAEAVTVFRGPDTFNYVCTGFHCETRPVPGDPKTYFDNTETTAAEHEEAGTKLAGGSAGGGTH